jgi:hypothetical protein
MIRKHNDFRLSLLDCHTMPTASRLPDEPQLMVVDDCDEWDVDRILYS